MLKKIIASAFLALGIGLSGVIQAANVLVLHPNETAADALSAINNIRTEFQAAGATVTVNATELSNGAAMNPIIFTTGSGVSYDIVVIATAYNAIDAVDWPVIQSAVQARLANSFLFFVDSCCQAASNATPMRNLLSTASGWTVGVGAFVGVGASPSLNDYPSSPYSTSFSSAGLTTMYGAAFSYITGVPANNALYLPAGTSPLSGTAPTPAYAAILPATQSFGGAGACVFATIDLNSFVSTGQTYGQGYPYTQSKIGPAFLNAATAAGGACGLPARVSKAFSPTSLSPGDTSTLTITVSNLTNPAAAVNGLNVADSLPSPLQISGPVTTTCTGGTLTGAVGTTSVQLAGASLPAGGCTITVPVTWPSTTTAINACGTGASVTNTITPGTDFTTAGGQVNIPATATLTCNAAGPIAVTKTASTTAVVPGGSLSYTITVSNTGANAASNVVVTDTVPAAVTSATWTCAGAACPTANGIGNISQTIVNLPGGGSVTYTLTGTVIVSPPPQFTNTVSVNPGNALCDSGNPAPCTASATVPPVGMVDITKTSPTASVTPGGTVTYQVTVTTTGSVPATNVVVTDATPTGVTGGSWTCTGTCGAASGSLPLSDTIASLAAGGTATYTISATVTTTSPPSTIVNTATTTPGNSGVCTNGVTPPCNSDPVTTLVALPISPSLPVPIPLWASFCIALLLLSAGISFKRRSRS